MESNSRTNNSGKLKVTDTGSGLGSTWYSNVFVEAETFVCTPSPCNNFGDHKRPNSYSFVKDRRTGFRGKQKYQYNHHTGVVKDVIYEGEFGDDPGRFGLARDNSNTCYNKCLGEVYDSIKNSEVSLNTSLGEGRESLEMMVSIMKSARKPLKSLRTLVRSLKKNPLQTFGGNYLGYSVGLKPLIEDVHNLIEHFSNGQQKDALVFRAVANARSSVNVSVVQTKSYVNDTYTRSDRCQISLDYEVSDLPKFDAWRLGLTARPTLIWELTRLSFVVDYFVNIGQYLENWEAAVANNGFAFHSGYRTDTTLENWASKWDQNTGTLLPGAGTTFISGDNEGFRERKTKVRTALGGFPVPAYPSIKIPKASGPLLNIAALLSQLLTLRK